MAELKSHDFPEVYEKLKINLSKMGCVMLDLEPSGDTDPIEIDGEELALYHSKNKERFWIDGWVLDDAHVTLLYGLLEDTKTYAPHIKSVLKGWKISDIEVEDVGFFDSPYKDDPYYCLIAHIKVTPELLEGHQRLSFLPHVNTYNSYKPHMTICYIDKEKGEKYRDKVIKQLNKMWKGKKLKVKKEINLGDKK